MTSQMETVMAATNKSIARTLRMKDTDKRNVSVGSGMDDIGGLSSKEIAMEMRAERQEAARSRRSENTDGGKLRKAVAHHKKHMRDD